MILLRFESYKEAEKYLINEILYHPDFITPTMNEIINASFVIEDPANNKNGHSNYAYAEHFFEWLMTGEKNLSEELLADNPWVARFVDTVGLPDNFSASYGWKIKEQIAGVVKELASNADSRRAYLNILFPTDAIIRTTKTTHEYPCTIGLQFLIRDNRLHLIVNMRSNNVYKVMPYDVYNFTRLQCKVAEMMGVSLGFYHHQINSAHIYKGDVRRLKEGVLWM